MNRRKTVVLPLCYFPPIGWWVQALRAEHVILDPWEFNIKQSYRNRCKIYGPNGVQTLTVVTDNLGSKTPMNQSTLVNYEPWRKVHAKAFESAYYSAPFFEFFKEALEKIILGEYPSLAQLNEQTILWLNEVLELNIPFQLASEFKKDYPNALDLRPGKKSEFLKIDHWPQYRQVFADKGKPFASNLSLLDLLFNMGLEARLYFKNIQV